MSSGLAAMVALLRIFSGARSRSPRPRRRGRRARPTRGRGAPACRADVLGVGVDVHEVGAHRRAVALDDRRHERHRDARRGEGDDRVGDDRALGGDVDLGELACRSTWRRRCDGRSSGRRRRRTRWPRGGGARRARGSRPAAPATGRPRCRDSHGSCTGRYREPPHRFESDANRLTPDAACARMRRMPRSYKICSPFVPGIGGHDTVAGAVSDQLAANERVDNTRVVPLRRGADMRLRAAVEKFKLWDNGRRLRVKFIDGVPEVQDKVAKIAKEWETVANIRLDFVTGTSSELRVSFAEKGFSWSTVGTDALTVRAHQGDRQPRVARAVDGDARVPAGGAPRVRSRPRHDPRAPEPGRPGRDPVGQAEGRTPTTPSRAGRRTTSTRTSSRCTRRTARTTPSSTRRRSWSTPSPTR